MTARRWRGRVAAASDRVRRISPVRYSRPRENCRPMFASLNGRPRVRLGARLSNRIASLVPATEPVFAAGVHVPLARS